MNNRVQDITSTDEIRARPILVLLHGWGVENTIWTELLPLLETDFDLRPINLPGYNSGDSDSPADIDTLCKTLLPSLPARANYLGWSLGGLVATYLAANHPNRVSTLATIASTPRFIANRTWLHGMSAKHFAQFEKRLRSSRNNSLKYFAHLQAHGDQEYDNVLRQLQLSLTTAASDATLANGLSILKNTDLRKEVGLLKQPHLMVLGNEDKLVPSSMSTTLPDNITAWSVSGSGHVPFKSRPRAVAARLRDFFLAHQPIDISLRDKKTVAHSFSNATDYDSAAELQREVGWELLRRLQTTSPPNYAVDLGCGTGCFTEALAKTCRATHTVGLDLALGMLKRASKKADIATWLCADAEQLPLATNSVDLFFSNFSIQWCEHLERLSSEISRCLRPKGYLYLSTLGSNTLWELRSAWAMVDNNTHVNNFAPINDFKKSLSAAGLSIQNCDITTWNKRVDDPIHLARELKQIGAHNINLGRAKGLTGKGLWRRLTEAYNSLNDDQPGLPVTWEVGFIIAKKEE